MAIVPHSGTAPPGVDSLRRIRAVWIQQGTQHLEVRCAEFPRTQGESRPRSGRPVPIVMSSLKARRNGGKGVIPTALTSAGKFAVAREHGFCQTPPSRHQRFGWRWRCCGVLRAVFGVVLGFEDGVQGALTRVGW